MIRPYAAKDKPETIALLRQNTPAYFDPSEEADFNHYLDVEREDYFVYEEEGRIVGAGGINYFPKEKTARISWDMVDPAMQGKGIGKKLTQFRIDHILKDPRIAFIVVRTSQLAYAFYEKMGFEVVSIEQDYWAKNYHLYQMQMPITQSK